MIDHKADAERLLDEGREVVSKLIARHELGDYERADDYGKQALGIWAQAQAHATLELAEQQRIANMIAVATHNDKILRHSYWTLDVDLDAERARVAAWFADIREALGALVSDAYEPGSPKAEGYADDLADRADSRRAEFPGVVFNENGAPRGIDGRALLAELGAVKS